MRFRRRGTCFAFTLIELLVVIAIVSILAAILFPVFAQAREKARLAVCASNLRQIGLGFTQYEQDFDEMFPCDTSDINLWQGEHFRWLIMPYLGINQKKVARNTPGQYGATSANAAILTCPSDAAASSTNMATNYNGTSYAYCAAFFYDPTKISVITTTADLYGPAPGFPLQPSPQSLAEVQTPTLKILSGEWTDNHDYLNQTFGWWGLTPITWHNYVFVDGHVKYLPTSLIKLGTDGLPDPNCTVNGIAGFDVAP